MQDLPLRVSSVLGSKNGKEMSLLIDRLWRRDNILFVQLVTREVIFVNKSDFAIAVLMPCGEVEIVVCKALQGEVIDADRLLVDAPAFNRLN